VLLRFPGRLPCLSRGTGCSGALYLFLGLLLLTTVAQAEDFRVASAGTYLEQGIYLLDARIRYRFRNEPLDALQNGVPLVVGLDIEVFRRREWLWDETITSLKLRFRLEYHALSRQYLVTNLTSGEVKSFPNLQAAAGFLGRIDRFPLLDANLLTPGGGYFVRLRANLDIDALPVPLQLVAYLSTQWRLTSEWYVWSL
jgi:hypothetical protein